MEKRCQQCGRAFEAKLDRAKFCSGSCRALSSQGVKAVAALPDSGAAGRPDDLGFIAAVQRRIDESDLSSSPDGLAAMLLVRAMQSTEDGSKLAALYGKFTVAMDRLDALAPRQGAVDDLRLRRDRKRARPA